MLATHQAEEMRIHFQIEINAPPEKVWTTLTSPEAMSQWLSKHLVLEVKEGGEFRMDVNIPDEGEYTFFGEVVRVDPPRELAFTWTEHEKGKNPWPASTLVSFKLHPSASGTLVSLAHTGFEALDAAIARQEYEGHIVGWERAQTLQELKKVVEAA